MHALEQEAKLEVPSGWTMPDLAGVLPGSRAERLPLLDMVAIYYDTEDGDLEDHKVTLRLRKETPAASAAGEPHEPGAYEPGPHATDPEPAAIWTVKLPGAPCAKLLNRTEVTWGYEGDIADALTSVPEADRRAGSFVRALTAGKPLVPIARLETARQRVQLVTSDGRPLAEVAYDCVTGTNLVRASKRLGATTVVFCELEVELAPGSALEVIEAIVEKLRACGARRSKRRSKLATVMQMTTQPSGAKSQSRTEDRARKPAAPATIAELVSDQARQYLQALERYDVRIRLSLLNGADAGEDIHQARVATRRARTVFGSVARAPQYVGTTNDVEPLALDGLLELTEKLKSLSDNLGTARGCYLRYQALSRWDEDVKTRNARQASGETVAGDIRPLLERAGNDLAAALRCLEEELNSTSYDALLLDLRYLAAGAAVEMGAFGKMPARSVLAEAGAYELDAVRRKVRAAKREPSDRRLHRARIQAKKLRYLGELVAAITAGHAQKKGKKIAAHAEQLQKILGDLHDAAEMGRWLQSAVQGLGEDAALAAGQFMAICQSKQKKSARRWEGAWRDLQEVAGGGWLARPEGKSANKSGS